MDADHSVWGRAEDMKMPRPSYSVSPTKPGAVALGWRWLSHIAPSALCAQAPTPYYPVTKFLL